MGRPWEEALDVRTDIYEWWASDNGVKYAKGFISSVEKKMNGMERAMYSDMTARFRSALRDADPIYITPDMQTIVEAAAQTVQLQTLDPTDLITLQAIVLLPRPIAVRDINDQIVSFRVIHWWPITYTRINEETGSSQKVQGLQIAFYHKAGDKDDYYDASEKHWSRWILNFSLPWFFGIGGHGDDPEILESYTGKFLIALWRLMQQRIAVRSTERATAPFRARASRAQLEEKHVVLVTLRRPNAHQTDGEPREIEWTHQWLVSGHWRMQPYADGIVKQIWINPYVKGPQHLPLAVPTTKVYTLVR